MASQVKNDVGNDDVQLSAFMQKIVGTTASAASAAAPNPGTAGVAEPVLPVTIPTVSNDNGGNGQPPNTTSDGGGGGGSWWDRLSRGNKIFALIGFGLVTSFLLHTWQIHWELANTENEAKVQEIKNRMALSTAAADAEVAKLKAEASRMSVLQAKPTVTSSLVVDVSTFDCTTHEKMNHGFATTSTVDSAEGSQLMIRSGCANVRFNHKITSLRGSGYVVTFEPVNNSNIEACGNGASGKDDAPSTCIDYINKHIGETLHVVVSNNSFVKLGG